MRDDIIIDMYFSRSESAIEETDKKYGKYLKSISRRILNSDFDAEECVSDTYLKAWESIPPTRPEKLSLYLGRIVRNISVNRFISQRRKRRFAECELVLDELSEVIPDSSTDLSLADEITLRDALNSFLSALPKNKRILFVKRYWYACSIKDISRETGYSESNVKVTLMRLRSDLRLHLEREGIRI